MRHFAQFVLLYLLRRRHREDIEEVNILRNLEPADLVFAENLNVVFGDFRSVGADDERSGLLAVFLRGAADNSDIANAGHRTEEVLDLLGRNILAAADDKVFKTARDEIVTFLVHAPDIAGVEPAVGVDTFRGLFGHIVIALHVVKTAAADFAIFADRSDFARFGVDDGDLDTGKRLTDRLTLTLD